MPFDGSGNYSRVHDWTTDRDNGIKIRADRMDNEFDDIAASLNVVFFRNGLVPMTGDLAMGANDIKGIASGTVAAPSIQFSADPNTGLYLVGVGELGITANGVQRLRAHSTGVAVTGVADISGAATVGGTLGVTGATTLSSTLGVTGATTLSSTLGVTGASTLAGLSATTGAFSSNVTVSGTLGITGALTGAAGSFTSLTVGGSAVWTAGNDGAGSGLDADTVDGVQASAFAQLASANTFTNAQTVSVNGATFVINGPTGGARIELQRAGVAEGGLSVDTDAISLYGAFGTALSIAASGGAVAVTGTAFTFGGSTVWTAGNDGAGSGLDADTVDGVQAAAFALLAGATFTGDVGIGVATVGDEVLRLYNTQAVVGTYQLDIEGYPGGYSAAINFSSKISGGSGSAISMARIAADGEAPWDGTAANQDSFLRFYTTQNGALTERMRLSSAGVLTVGGSTVWHAGNDGAGSGLDADTLDGAQGALYLKGARTSQLVTDGTAAPSGGSDGDIYFQYV